ncbi:MAG TPA: NAD-dependent epimerase/dehydratase family protein [Candidatus Eremiobacteraceae bacterium]|nr:NAD-dependent epimerase/dehydratase family protein [Candidatus Eremiobacteraceae bacterium]
MKVLISGVCGFAGSHLARYLMESSESISIAGIDNLARPGSETNRSSLKREGVQLYHGDVRLASDLEALPVVDWVIDAAAQPSVLAGRDGKTSTRQLLEHNLLGTINLLEYCRKAGSGLVLLSTSRVYSIQALTQLPLRVESCGFTLDPEQPLPPGLSSAGVDETFSTEAPISLYGATKLASERLAEEYAAGFQVPVWINRCGVLAGGGQFGTAEQGIFSYWLHAHSTRRTLRYLGFGGQGLQVRDALHPRDLARMVDFQLRSSGPGQLFNVSGGRANSMSLAQLTTWCDQRFGPHQPIADGSERPYDIPWLILDSSRALTATSWEPSITLEEILEEIADHAVANPDWLTRCGL